MIRWNVDAASSNSPNLHGNLEALSSAATSSSAAAILSGTNLSATDSRRVLQTNS